MQMRYKVLSIAVVVAISLAAAYSAADEYFEHGERHFKAKKQFHGKERGHGDHGPIFVEDSKYVNSCGGCHWAYVPQLLPSESWRNIMASLGDHFGSSVVISDQEKSEVSNYLLVNAADKTSMKIGSKIAGCLNGAAPSRITDVPYIVRKHRGVSPDVFKRKSIGALANCIACHASAPMARFDDDNVQIPSE